MGLQRFNCHRLSGLLRSSCCACSITSSSESSRLDWRRCSVCSSCCNSVEVFGVSPQRGRRRSLSSRWRPRRSRFDRAHLTSMSSSAVCTAASRSLAAASSVPSVDLLPLGQVFARCSILAVRRPAPPLRAVALLATAAFIVAHPRYVLDVPRIGALAARVRRAARSPTRDIAGLGTPRVLTGPCATSIKATSEARRCSSAGDGVSRR